jgi:7-cyano-7-deazaguanine synthase
MSTGSKKVVVLLSGGMDSVGALYEANARYRVVGALSFHYGSKHNDREIPCATLHAARLKVPHQVISLGFIGEFFKSDLLKSGGEIPKGHYEAETMAKTVVPFRNGIMLSIAAGYAESLGAGGLVIAAHAGDHAIYPDCREEFMRAIADAVRLGTYAGIEVLRPFIEMTKAQIARRGAGLGIDFAETWSCYVGGEIQCGECGTCVERREAFRLSGVPDPTRYLRAGPLPQKPT